LQQLAGIFLCGDSILQMLIVFYGLGANGKSTFIELLAWLLGDYASPIQTEMLMQQKRESHAAAADIVNLKGKRLAYCNEIEEGRRLSESNVKLLTGNDTLTGRAPHAKSYITFQPSHKLVMIGNHLPEIHDTSEGMWRRMLLIHFNQTIPADKRDPRLLSKLKAEGSGVLNWALAGYRDYLQHDLRIPANIKAATNAYRTEQDIFGDWLQDHCIITTGARTPTKECYKAYQIWAKQRGQFPLMQPRFTRRLADKGYPTDAGRRNIIGISLNTEGLAAAKHLF
jgi:putative DNA primase/helicase